MLHNLPFNKTATYFCCTHIRRYW